jgi:hypothetical protein
MPPQAPAGESPVNGGLGALRIAGAANPSVQRKMHDMDSRLHAAEAPQIVEHQIGIFAFFRPHHRWRVTHTQLHKDGSSFRCDGDPTKRWRRTASTETPPDPMPSGVNSFHLPWKNWQTANQNCARDCHAQLHVDLAVLGQDRLRAGPVAAVAAAELSCSFSLPNVGERHLLCPLTFAVRLPLNACRLA